MEPESVERAACTALARRFGMAAVVLAESTIELMAVRVLSRGVAHHHGVLPVAFDGGALVVACAQPLIPARLLALEEYVGFRVELVLASEPVLRAAIDAVYDAAEQGLTIVRGRSSPTTAPRLARIEAAENGSMLEMIEPVA
jgi:hypothetical protein